jgi:hypothetical protein
MQKISKVALGLPPGGLDALHVAAVTQKDTWQLAVHVCVRVCMACVYIQT